MMKCCWFQDKDGTYYRNIPLIMAEQRRAMRWPLLHRRFKRLEAEWQVAWREGVIRKAKLERGDKLVQPAPFREVYPDKPEEDEW